MRDWLMAGALRIALGAAVAATPVVFVGSASAALTSAETSQAARLAESIVKAVRKIQGEVGDLSDAAQAARIELAVQQAIRDSAVSPEVAQAAVDMAFERLKVGGELVCVAPTRDVEETCNPPGLALASISGVLQQVVATQTTTTTATPGPIPIGDPATLGPTSGTSDYRGG